MATAAFSYWRSMAVKPLRPLGLWLSLLLFGLPALLTPAWTTEVIC